MLFIADRRAGDSAADHSLPKQLVAAGAGSYPSKLARAWD